MPLQFALAGTQRRWKDCYAPAPKIDLTLRCNGEEKVSVMDSLGIFHPAGFDTPTGVPVVSTLGTAGQFTAARYWQYRYAYVAKKLFPLVENAITGGSSLAPRSNPSPAAVADSITNTNRKRVTIPTTGRTEISHIWIYRSSYGLSAAEAATYSQGGNMFWIGEVENNPNSSTAIFDDDGSNVGQEQIENDNFAAPQFQFCVYADPYFWGFGNNPIWLEVILDSDGLMILTGGDPDRWYDGRDGQTVILRGITSGGYDNNGSFYFKWISNVSGRLYLDPELTIAATPPSVGTTVARIKGLSTTLFRSKERNPFSWGVTDLVGTLQVPRLWFFSVGGGIGTAIAVVPNVNLLKLDTEAPSKSFTLNLKNAGTPNFESSYRPFADNFSVSNHFSQFAATITKDESVLWGIDSKVKSVIQCDGANQNVVSGPVRLTLQEMSPAWRHMFHGVYHPRLELNCLFFKTDAVPIIIDKMVYNHGPTGQWGIMDAHDIQCSALMLHPTTKELKVIVGSANGWVGEFMAQNVHINWYQPDIPSNDQGRGVSEVHAIGDELKGTFHIAQTGLVGNWVRIILDSGERIWARISSASSTILNFDHIIGGAGTIPPVAAPPGHRYYIGLVECEAGRMFSGQLPYDYKKLAGIWATWRGIRPALLGSLESPIIEFRGWEGIETTEFAMIAKSNTDINVPLTTEDQFGVDIFSLETIPFNFARNFGMIIRDRNYAQSQLMNYELRGTPDASNG